MGGSSGMVQDKSLLAENLLGMGRRGTSRLGCHQDRAGWRDAGSKAGSTHGAHGHVGAVRSRNAWLRRSWVEGHHSFAVHELMHGQLVGFLLSSPFGSSVLKPNLQK